jgi:hypothetical protein
MEVYSLPVYSALNFMATGIGVFQKFYTEFRLDITSNLMDIYMYFIIGIFL